jgi:hypothetical protein
MRIKMIDDRMCDHLNFKIACDLCIIEQLEIENKEIKRYLQIHHTEMKQLKAELDTLRKLAGEYKLALDRRWV